MHLSDTHIIGIVLTITSGFIALLLAALGYFLKSFREEVRDSLEKFSTSLIDFGNKVVKVTTSLEHTMINQKEIKQSIKAHEQFCAVEFKDTHTRIINLEHKLKQRIHSDQGRYEKTTNRNNIP